MKINISYLFGTALLLMQSAWPYEIETHAKISNASSVNSLYHENTKRQIDILWPNLNDNRSYAVGKNRSILSE